MMRFHVWPKQAKNDVVVRQKITCWRQFWNEHPERDTACSFYSFSFGYLRPIIIRYSEKHIGLGTKRYVDSLGSC